jgi:periplasmic glucans biosynthesis protein
VVTAASGAVERVAVNPVIDTDKWRAMFDFTVASANPADIRPYLRQGKEALSETWLFQHLPSLSVI